MSSDEGLFVEISGTIAGRNGLMGMAIPQLSGTNAASTERRQK